MVSVVWKGNMEFAAEIEDGVGFTMDAYGDAGGHGKGPTPVEAMLSSIAACTAMDVISILAKKKQVVTSYRVEVEGDRTEPGVYPRPFTQIRVKHILTGENLDPIAVARSVELSDEKYCTVASTLRSSPELTTSWEIEN